MYYRLHNALVVQSTERSPCAPTHFLQHGPSPVFGANFWSSGANDFTIPIGNCCSSETATASRTASGRSDTTFASLVHAWEESSLIQAGLDHT